MNKKYLFIDYFFILLIFFFIYFYTKKFSLINFDTSIYINQFWRIYNGQVPHIDFHSPFGPFVYYQYYIYNFFIETFRSSTPNFSYQNIINYSDIFKIFISTFVISYFFLFHYVFSKLQNFNRILFYLLIFFIGSFFISPRGYGYVFLLSLTSYYNMYIEGALILTIYTFILSYLFFFELNEKINFKHLLIIFVLGFFNFQLILIKITAGILIFPIALYFLIKNLSFKKIIKYYVFGYFSGFIFSLFFFGYDLIFEYSKDVLETFKIFFFDIENTTTRNSKTFFLIISNCLIDLLSVCIFIIILKYFKTEIYKKLIKVNKNIFTIFLFCFGFSFLLQFFSDQNPESNLRSLFCIFSLYIIFTSKNNFLKNKIYIFILLLFPIWTLFKNIIFPILLFFLSLFLNSNFDLLKKLSVSVLLDNENFKKIEEKIDYANLNSSEKILYLTKRNDIEIEKIISLIDTNEVVSDYLCQFPVSYFTNTKPSKNSNLYWHYGVTYGDSINTFSIDDDTTYFLICLKKKNDVFLRREINENLSLNNFFDEVYYDKGIMLLKNK